MPKVTTSSSSSKSHAASSVDPSRAAAAAAALTSATSATTAIRSLWDCTFSNGDTYHGEALYVHDKNRNPVKDGKGRYTWASSGAVYDGDWKGGLPHGTGVISVPGIDGYEYVGEFKDGKRSGKGCCQFSNGRVYEGEWREDEMNGTGTLRGASNVDNFTEYTGGFQNGMRSGRQGRCVYVNGDVYDGSWAAGKRQGVGEWQLHRPATGAAAAAASRPVRYRGAFDGDAPQASGTGEGELEYADGSLYTGGTDAQMRRHGKGVHCLSSGVVFEGSFVQDRREGRGVLQGGDGAVCEGHWHNDQLNGEVRVTFTVASSSLATSSTSIASLLRLSQSEYAGHPMKTYHGPCVAGIFTGAPAVITYMDGSSYNGAVRHGVPHGSGVLRDRPFPCSTGTRGIDADSAVRKRIPVTCVPHDALLTLTCYDGTFSNGEADGNGTGEWRTDSSTQQAPPASSPPTEAPITPQNFMQVLGTGLRCWDLAMYGRLDGTYTGQWARGLPHGQGTWEWSDGSRYSGAVAQYVPSGAGTLSASSVQYTGDFQEGQAGGNGVWEDKARGLKYEGQWLAGRPHGWGVATLLTAASPSSPQTSTPKWLVSSRVYEGSWANGNPSGQGREYTTEDRRCVAYEGSYADGYREGEGTISFGDTDGATGDTSLSPHYLKYKGSFSRGVPGGGAGCLTLRNKTSIEGCFDAQLQPLAGRDVSIKSGNETWTFKGVYDAAKHTGCGVMTFTNGDVYVGEVEDASCGGGLQQQQQALFHLQCHGRGTYKFVEGNQLQCTWRHNVLHGAGTYTSSDGVQTERNYADGVLAGGAVVATSGGGIGGGAGGAHVEADTGVLRGNVFTPENEFPNTLSAEVLKSRMSEVPQESPLQPRKRQPFSFMRKGEARRASAAGEATAAPGGAASVGASLATSAQRRSSQRDLKDTKKQLGPPPAAANQKRSPRTSVVSSAAPNITGTSGRVGAGSPPRATCGGTVPSTKGASPVASPLRSTAKYNTLRRPQRTARNAPPPAAVASFADGASPIATTPTNARPSLMHRAKDGNDGAGATAPTSSAYLSKFQAGIRLLDTIPRADSPTPSAVSRNLTPTAKGSSCPATTPAQPGSRGRLSSALAAGRAQEIQQRVLKPLKGSLKALMDEASSIRSTREDEIHLLTEEMRELNERIWQLRFTLGTKKEEDSGRGVGKKAYAAAAPSTKPERKRSSVSQETLDTLVQERRVIMEKLQHVVNEHGD
ncbi:conserved hypothetical protein [Leishmania mexicana MHOM/GT/2001/U1103]|uniref:MORN repeat-containing protein n=1 Tax=Leishmania mexicana (strain MHOM/GT/2001/U1103) TaxID=929439 RepID=E9ALQ3_LEIMU|nr:conserved hypothetical protein [Leishmania mexicana MHOM/GT/2001/U1103]CBZ23858.1 conserved hypothetical protein [Leishmania mexicana MHOM/GT/2001/U1103]